MCLRNIIIALIYFICYTFPSYFGQSPRWRLRENTVNQNGSPEELNLTNSYFLYLRNYQVNAWPASPVDFPWIARVLHTTESHSKPQLCTAICIDDGIFITAARCVILLKIQYTWLVYQDTRLKPKAFVLPTNESKQMFDDVGFIIVHVDEFGGIWKSVPLLEDKRTDGAFKWFGDKNFEDFEHIVVGYAKFKSDESALAWKRRYHLTALKVHVGLNVCREILMYNQRIDGFAVPCYHSCTLAMFEGRQMKARNATCHNYHGSEGSALINLKTGRLIGIATWGAYFDKYELPVGFAIPNSDSFFEDKQCAEKIRDQTNYFVEPGAYQELCDDK